VRKRTEFDVDWALLREKADVTEGMLAGEACMPGDPKECREHAACCRNLAASASNAVARESFTNLADSWERLARELECAQSFLEGFDGIGTADQQKPREAINLRPSSTLPAGRQFRGRRQTSPPR
jgi:hypothetical protein